MALYGVFLALCGIVFCIVCAGCILIRTCLLVITVQGQSMSPLLKHGDRVAVLRRFRLDWIRKGQIVLFQQAPPAQRHPSSLTTFHIKRVVALAGETFLSSTAPLWENEHVHCHQSGDTGEVVYLWQIPHKHIFVCGDHREESIDSRKWGPLPVQNVRGIVLRKLPRKPEYPARERPFRMPG